MSKQRALATGRLAVQFVEILTNPGRKSYNIVVQLALNIGGPGTKVIAACGSWLTCPSKNAQKVNTWKYYTRV